MKGELKDRSEVKRTSKPWEDTFLLAPCVEGKFNSFMSVNHCIPQVTKVKTFELHLFLMVVTGLQANRWSNCGTWLLLALKDIFKNHAHNLDLGSMKNLVRLKSGFQLN